MDDYGNTYSCYMSTAACLQWYISITAYGGYPWDSFGFETI